METEPTGVSENSEPIQSKQPIEVNSTPPVQPTESMPLKQEPPVEPTASTEIDQQTIPIPSSFSDIHPDLNVLLDKNTVAQFEEAQVKLKGMIEKYLPEMQDYYLSPGGYNLILDILKNSSSKELLKWKFGEIKPILGKMLIPDSIKPTLDNAKKIGEHFKTQTDKVEILELCTGAGISAMMMWKEAKKNNPNTRFEIATVDNATESQVVAYILLKLNNVPVRWVTREMLENGKETDFDGVSLIGAEASQAIDYYQKKDTQFNAITSDHGINYFENSSHDSMVEQVPGMLKTGGVLQLCALENTPKVSLDYKAMAGHIMLSNKDLLQTIPNDQKPYNIKESDGITSVTAINSKESAGLYMILREMLKTGKFGLFKQYLGNIIDVSKATKELAREVKSPISHTKEKLSEMGLNTEISPSYEEQPLSIARSLFYTKP